MWNMGAERSRHAHSRCARAAGDCSHNHQPFDSYLVGEAKGVGLIAGCITGGDPSAGRTQTGKSVELV